MANIGQVALVSGLGIGAATAIGTFVAHERLERDGEWTNANSKLSTTMTLGALTGATAALSVGMLADKPMATGIGGGILFGVQAGHVAGMLGAMAID